MRRRDETISLSCREAPRYSYIYFVLGGNRIFPRHINAKRLRFMPREHSHYGRRLTFIPRMSPLVLAFCKRAGKRGSCRMELQIEMLTWMAGDLQPSTHNFPTRMPEIDHAQKVPISGRQRSPRSGHIFCISGIMGTTIRLPPVAKTLIERQRRLIAFHRRHPALLARAPAKPDIAQDPPGIVRYRPPATLPFARQAQWRGETSPLACACRSSTSIDRCTARPVVGARLSAFRRHSKT